MIIASCIMGSMSGPKGIELPVGGAKVQNSARAIMPVSTRNTYDYCAGGKHTLLISRRRMRVSSCARNYSKTHCKYCF